MEVVGDKEFLIAVYEMINNQQIYIQNISKIFEIVSEYPFIWNTTGYFILF